MKIMLFGATGMVGQGILRTALADPAVSGVTIVVRQAINRTAPKLRQIIQRDIADIEPLRRELASVDAVIFAIGVSITTAGPELFKQINGTMPLAVASVLATENPKAAFVYISAHGVDPTEQSSVLWKRLRGQTENRLRALPLGRLSIFRPLVILPTGGEQSRTRAYRFFYGVFGPILRPFQNIFPQYITTTSSLGSAAMRAARHGTSSPICDSREINRLGEISG